MTTLRLTNEGSASNVRYFLDLIENLTRRLNGPCVVSIDTEDGLTGEVLVRVIYDEKGRHLRSNVQTFVTDGSDGTYVMSPTKRITVTHNDSDVPSGRITTAELQEVLALMRDWLERPFPNSSEFIMKAQNFAAKMNLDKLHYGEN